MQRYLYLFVYKYFKLDVAMTPHLGERNQIKKSWLKVHGCTRLCKAFFSWCRSHHCVT